MRSISQTQQQQLESNAAYVRWGLRHPCSSRAQHEKAHLLWRCRAAKPSGFRLGSRCRRTLFSISSARLSRPRWAHSHSARASRSCLCSSPQSAAERSPAEV